MVINDLVEEEEEPIEFIDIGDSDYTSTTRQRIVIRG